MEDTSNKRGEDKTQTEEEQIMYGLVSQIIDKASEGKTDATILEIAIGIREQALEKLDPEIANNRKYIEACNTIIGYIEANPEKKVLDMFKENRKKNT